MPYKCRLCPNNCIITDKGKGICGVRECNEDKLSLPFYGLLSAVSNDPIEKKPLYHFYPGSSIFSVGFYGCNLSCPFCQNYRISKSFSKEGRSVSPEQLINSAVSSGATAIAYTYSEPIVHFEWVTETAKLASESGIKNVLVTNGYINSCYSKLLLKNLDAVNVDLKAFNNNFYNYELKGKLQPVMDFIETAAALTHTEVTTLVIPGKNDSINEIEAAAEFLAGIDKNIVYHLSAYYPSYKYSISPTTADLLYRLAETASKYLNFVFTGNINGGLSDSFCPECGNKLISRSGYIILKPGIESGRCSSCRIDLKKFNIILN